MLLDVGFQDRIEMLKFSVSDQSNDKYLRKQHNHCTILKIFNILHLPLFYYTRHINNMKNAQTLAFDYPPYTLIFSFPLKTSCP